MRARSGVCVAVAVLATVSGCSSRSVRGACLQTRVGEPLADVAARLDRTGATHTSGSPTTRGPDQHRWQKMDTIGFGAASCYVLFDKRGEAVSVDYHEGN